MSLGLIIQPRSHIPPRGWPECAGIRWVVGKKKIMEGNRKAPFAYFAPLREAGSRVLCVLQYFLTWSEFSAMMR